MTDVSIDMIARPDTLVLLMAALILEAIVGGLPLFFRIIPHPVVIVGFFISQLDQRLNRENRSDRARFIRGFLLVVLLVGLVAFAGKAIADFAGQIPYGWGLELFFLVILIAQRSLFDHVRDVGRALDTKGLAAGRDAVSHIVGRDPDSLDEHAVCRAAIESCAENFSDGVVSPVFWYVLLGLPGLFVYKTVNTMDSMIGHKSSKYFYFGKTAARLDDLMNYIPARLAGAFLVLAACFTPTANPKKALATMLKDAARHSSPNAGWPEGAVAGALSLSLAGPRRYGAVLVDDEWIGDGRARTTPRDIFRTLYLYVVAGLLQLGLVAVVLAFQLAAPGQMASRWQEILLPLEKLRDLF